MPRSVRLLAAACLPFAAFALSPGGAGGDEPRPSWRCLPADTAVLARMPRPAEFLEAIRGRTKFGAVALSERRLRGALEVLLDGAAADGRPTDAVEQSLATYGLHTDDIAAAFRGDVGAGVVCRGRQGGLRPVVMLLAWIEPGDEVAARMVAASQRRIEEVIAADATGTTRRIDVAMAGHEVLWLVEPVMGIDVAALGLDGAADTEDRAELEKRIADLQARLRDATPVKVGHAHAFLARLGGRLVYGQTVPMAVAKPGAAAPDLDAEAGADEAREIVERFLAAHAEMERGPLDEVLATPGMDAALPGGVPLLDVVVDPRVLLRTFGDATAAERVASVGGADLGPVAWRQSLDEGRFHSGLFVSLPAPRQSLMRMLDQACDAAEVPPFVTREATDVTQVSLDLGAAYETVREFVLAVGSPESANLFQAVDMQAQGWLGVTLADLLRSLGSRHWIVGYPPRAAGDGRGRADGAAADPREVADRLAIVWRVTDETAFGRVLQRLAGAVGGDLQEEQGFRGVRLPDGPAVFLGREHLVVGIGADSLEKTLAAIRNPPSGESSLRDSDVPRRAGDLLPLHPARLFGVSDSTRNGGTFGLVCEMVRSLTPRDVAEDVRGRLPAAQRLLPTSDELEGMFGVGVTTLRADTAGVSLRSAWEMPPP